MRNDEKNFRNIFVLSLVVVSSILTLPVQTARGAANQPFVEAAKRDLNNAKNALKRVTADKGRHRERAI